MRRIIITLASLIAFVGCSDKAKEPFHDAPRGTNNNDPADIFTMPDGFSNGSSKCDHGNRVYVIFHGDSGYGAIAVVPNDPSCNQ